MEQKLTALERRFVKEYLVDMNATKAAIRAGYAEESANSTGRHVKKKKHVAQAIKKEIEAREKRTEIKQDRVLKEFARIAFFDPRRLYYGDGRPKAIKDIDDDTASAIIGFDVQDIYEKIGSEEEYVGYLRKYRLADKLGALNSLAKHLGMFDGHSRQDDGKTENTVALADIIRHPVADRNVEDFENEPTSTIQPETETVL